MGLIVQKFGGSSVRDRERLLRAMRIVRRTWEQGDDVVVVLSAQGGMILGENGEKMDVHTREECDALLARARELTEEPPPRELDALLATGETASVALGAIALASLGVPAVSLSGWQVPVGTDGTHGGANVRSVGAERIRQELAETGYLRRSGKEKKGREKPIAPREFRSSSGLRILVGRSNVQNDALTRKADKRDLWLHTQKIHGSHVILCTEEGAYDDESLHEAALLAAYYSQAQGGSNVPVDYTSVKYVKKPAGARPGMVVYETYRTLYVTPDEETIRRLDRKNK